MIPSYRFLLVPTSAIIPIIQVSLSSNKCHLMVFMKYTTLGRWYVSSFLLLCMPYGYSCKDKGVGFGWSNYLFWTFWVSFITIPDGFPQVSESYFRFLFVMKMTPEGIFGESGITQGLFYHNITSQHPQGHFPPLTTTHIHRPRKTYLASRES